jgi:hypothetical protein
MISNGQDYLELSPTWQVDPELHLFQSTLIFPAF